MRNPLSVLLPLALAATALAQVPTFQAASNNAPGPRYGASLCALGNGSLLLFGGDDGSSRLGDTWIYDIAANTWTQVQGGGPSPRRWAAMTHHSSLGWAILHGGQGPLGDHGDTWVFDGTRWWLRTGTSPAARSVHTMAYDRGRDRTVLFGGHNRTDTWEWNGFGWAQRTLTASPSARTFASLVYDDRRGVMMLLGGSLISGSHTNQVWELGATSWTPAAVPLPWPRIGASFAYDRSRGRTVMFGGLQQAPGGATSAQADCYEWDGTAPGWVQRILANPITPRYGTNLVYRSGSGLWLFGGSGFGPLNGDLQRYFIQNGATYSQSGPGCGAPSLVASSDELPWLGEAFTRTAQFGLPKLVIHEIGFGPQDLDLGFVGMPGCRLGGTADIMMLVLVSGLQPFVLEVPNTLALNGTDLYEQLAVVTPGVNPLGIEMSPTMRMRLSAK
ncbi:MAG: kelch repeat-containing protein [Planctomycetes bacterium]|nr:kelch repeat-containing protein [Planctomycetota bacterium]